MKGGNDEGVLDVPVSVWDEQEKLSKLLETINDNDHRQVKIEIDGTAPRGYWKSQEHQSLTTEKVCAECRLFLQAILATKVKCVVKLASPCPSQEQEHCTSNAEFDAVSQIMESLSCTHSWTLQVTMNDNDHLTQNSFFLKKLTELLQKFGAPFRTRMMFRDAVATDIGVVQQDVTDELFGALLGCYAIEMRLPPLEQDGQVGREGREGGEEQPQHEEQQQDSESLATSFFHHLGGSWTNHSSARNLCRLRRISVYGREGQSAEAPKAAIQAFVGLFQDTSMHWLSVETAPPYDNPGGCTMMQGFSCPYRGPEFELSSLFWMKDKNIKPDLTLRIHGWPNGSSDDGVCPLELAICNSLQRFGTLPAPDDAGVDFSSVDAVTDGPSDSGDDDSNMLKHLDVFFGRTTRSVVLARLLRHALGTNEVLQQQLHTLNLGIAEPPTERLRNLYLLLADLVPKLTSLRELTARPIFEVTVRFSLLPLPGSSCEDEELDQLSPLPTRYQNRILDSFRANTSIEKIDVCEQILPDIYSSYSVGATSKIRRICRRNQLCKLMDAMAKGTLDLNEVDHDETSKHVRPVALLPTVIKAAHDNQECGDHMVYNILRVVMPNIADDKISSTLQDSDR